MPKVSKKIKKIFVHSIKTLNPLKDLGLSSEELKAIAGIRGIKGCKSMSKGELLSALTPPKPAKKVKNQKEVFLKQK